MPTNIDVHQVREMLAAGAQLVEVLEREAYDHQHLPGAVHIDLEDVADRAPEMLAKDRPVIVYCSNFL